MIDYGGGLALGLANAVRHRVRGYTTPRPFSPSDVDRSVAYALRIASGWRDHVSFGGKRVLEIGPGPDLGTGAVLVASGALSYRAVDAFPLARRDTTEFFAALEKQIGPVKVEDLKYSLATFPWLPEVSGEYDVIVSNATLEHIEDVPCLFRRLRQLAPQGVMCHGIDAMTHSRWIRERDPLNILRYSDPIYRLMSFPGVPNRLRADDYRTAAIDAGFESCKVTAHRDANPEYLSRVRPQLAKQFRRRADLSLLTFTLVAH